MQAYELQYRMWLQQQQLIQAQRENNAKAAAIQQWGHIVPPDKLPQIATMIFQGAPYDQVARAAAQLSGQLIDDPNAMQQNIRYIEQLTGKPYDYASLGPPVAGPNTAKQANDWKVSQAGATAGATALGTKTGEQAAAAPYMNALVDDPSDTGTAKNIAIIEHLTGQPYDASKGPPIAGPLTLKSNQDWHSRQRRQGHGLSGRRYGGEHADQPRRAQDLSAPGRVRFDCAGVSSRRCASCRRLASRDASRCGVASCNAPCGDAANRHAIRRSTRPRRPIRTAPAGTGRAEH